MNIGNATRVMREQRQLSHNELAQKALLGTRALTDIEANRRHASTAELQRIADALDIPAFVLVYMAEASETIDSLPMVLRKAMSDYIADMTT